MIVSPKPIKRFASDGEAMTRLLNEWSYVDFERLGDVDRRQDYQLSTNTFVSSDGYLSDGRVKYSKSAFAGCDSLPEPYPYPPRHPASTGSIHPDFRYPWIADLHGYNLKK